MERNEHLRIIALLVMGLLFVSAVYIKETINTETSKELTERNPYGEVLLGLNAQPREPTDGDLYKGVISNGEDKYVVFESGCLECGDFGSTSYWKVK